jgi:hypothetical protein
MKLAKKKIILVDTHEIYIFQEKKKKPTDIYCF